MKKNLLSLMLLAVTGLPLLAQPFMTLHDFTELFNYSYVTANNPAVAWTNTDGAGPQAALILSGNTLYGTAEYGGDGGNGAIFALNTDGTGFTNLHSFEANFYNSENSDGSHPLCELVLSSNTLYGTASQGGHANYGAYGTIFKINIDGTGFVNLHNFAGGDGGAAPAAGLVLSSNALYGTTKSGGSSGFGTIFKINTDGSDFQVLYSFTGGDDGAYPVSKLVISSNTLFGTASEGGDESFLLEGNGTIFKINIDGTGFENLHSFTAGNYEGNNDGADPEAGMVLSGNTLYGTTANYGGLGACGTIFSIHTDGTDYATLYSFTNGNDGGYPFAGLIVSDNVLYGTSNDGGTSDNGVVFAINTDGTGFTTLYSFKSAVLPYNPNMDGGFPTNSDGAGPCASLILSGNILYGTATGGGNSGNGTAFSLSLLPPPLTIIHSAATVSLMWPTYAPGITLQCATNLVSPVFWSTNLPSPVILNGQNTVTDTISGKQMFYRLSQ